MMLRLLFGLLLGLWLPRCVVLAVFLQEANGLMDSNQDSDFVSGIGKIQKDYSEYLEKRRQMFQEYQTVLSTLKDTEFEIQKIQSEAVKQQLSALQSALQALDYEHRALGFLQDYNATTRPGGLPADGLMYNPVHRFIERKAKAELSVAKHEIELQQLTSSQRAVFQRRVETIQKGQLLHQNWGQWHADWHKFIERYWPHSDPERRFTQAEIEARLEILAKADPQDFAATITTALLLERLGKYELALEAIDNALIVKHSLQVTAQLAKVSILYSLKKNKEAKLLMLSITKSQSLSQQTQLHPIDRWLKARIAASQNQYSQSESEWKALVNVKPMELEARRALALLSFVRASKSLIEGKRAIKEAQMAMDLDPRADWFSHFVLAAAMHSAGQDDQALGELLESHKTAVAENLELCDRLRKHIENEEPFAWDFVRGYSR